MANITIQGHFYSTELEAQTALSQINTGEGYPKDGTHSYCAIGKISGLYFLPHDDVISGYLGNATSMDFDVSPGVVTTTDKKLNDLVTTLDETINNMLISDSYGTVYQRLKSEYNKGNITAVQIYKEHYRTKNYISDTEWSDFYSTLPTTTFAQKVDKKLTDLAIWVYGLLSTGYDVQGETYNLAIFDKDVLEFTKLLTMLNELLAQGFVNSSTQYMILDNNGDPHQMTVANLKTTLSLYGVYVNSIWEANTSYEATIKGLPDTEEGLATLNAIEFSL